MDDYLYGLLRDIFESSYHSNIISYEECDISEDNDNIYYTLVFKKELSKDDIDLLVTDNELSMTIKILDEDPYTLDTITPILPEKTVATLRNNILDITLVKDRMYRYKDGYTEARVVIND